MQVPPDSEAVALARLAWNKDLIAKLTDMRERYGQELRILETVMGAGREQS